MSTHMMISVFYDVLDAINKCHLTILTDLKKIASMQEAIRIKGLFIDFWTIVISLFIIY